MKTVSALTLGCKVNQYDTSAMLGLFREAGYEIVPWGSASDFALINTCTVTQTAERKCRAAIRQAASRGSAVCVCGCLAQKQKESLLDLPGVHWVVGTAGRSGVVDLIESGPDRVSAADRGTFEELQIADSGEHTRAFVKVQEGCAHFCSYCIIPFVRGRPQSRPLEAVLAEIRRLTEAGVREIVLTGTDLASYESDGSDLADLVAAAEASTGARRLRLGSLEPGLFSADFVHRLARSKILCPHFHLSLQSGSESILRAMNRRYTPSEFALEVDRLRSSFETPAISTDVMTGFPGEEPADFEATLAFVRDIGFARLHVFPYSQRAGTKAAGMDGQVPVAVRRARALELIQAGDELERTFAESQIGRKLSVLFEEGDGGMAGGYSERYIRVRAEGGVPGEVQTVQAVSALGAVLSGSICSADSPAW